MKFRLGIKIKSILVAFLAFLVCVQTIKAYDVPSFPSCTNPQGTLKVNYDSGIHSIPGKTGDFKGSDKVYSVSSNQALQCYCASDNAGIQTNWLKASDISDDQRNVLISQGWVFIFNGADWGLDEAVYLAKNSDFTCSNQTIPTPTIEQPAPQPCNGCGNWPSAPTCGATKPSTPTLTSVVRHATTADLTWTAAVPATHYAVVYGLKPGEYIYGALNIGNTTKYTVGSLDPGTTYYFAVRAVNDCMPSDLSNVPQVLGTSVGGADVLGLASTGTNQLLYLSLIAGCGFLALSIIAFRKA